MLFYELTSKRDFKKIVLFKSIWSASVCKQTLPVGWQEKWAVTCELPKDPGEFGCFGEAVLWFDPLKLSLRHSDSADWNRRFRTSLRPCKASMPFVACLHLLSVCLEESWLCQFYLLNVFVEDFRPNFLQVFVMTVRENRMYGWICLEGKLSGAWLSS